MYSRELDGTVLTLAASGWTYQSTFVLYDRELSLYPHFRMQWRSWFTMQPQTKLMVRHD